MGIGMNENIYNSGEYLKHNDTALASLEYAGFRVWPFASPVSRILTATPPGSAPRRNSGPHRWAVDPA